MKWTIYTIEFTCGATLIAKTQESEADIKDTLDFLSTRMCPQCQFDVGDIEPLELHILLNNDIDEYISSIRDEGTDA